MYGLMKFKGNLTGICSSFVCNNSLLLLISRIMYIRIYAFWEQPQFKLMVITQWRSCPMKILPYCFRDSGAKVILIAKDSYICMYESAAL